MDIKTISATLALLGAGTFTSACDDGKKPTTEVDAAKPAAATPAAATPDAKVEAKVDAKAAKKGEMSCAEGACGEGACGGKDGAKAKAPEAVHADDAKPDEAAAEAAAKAKQDKT